MMKPNPIRVIKFGAIHIGNSYELHVYGDVRYSNCPIPVMLENVVCDRRLVYRSILLVSGSMVFVELCSF